MSQLSSAVPVHQEWSSHRQTRILLLSGFGGLLALMVMLGVTVLSSMQQIEGQQDQIRREYVERDRILERLRSEIYLSGTYIRDFVLDADATAGQLHRTQFLEMRRSITRDLSSYGMLLRQEEHAAFHNLSGELDSYFAALQPALDWTAAERRAHGASFIEVRMLPQRLQAVGLTDRLQEITQHHLEASSQSLSGNVFSLSLPGCHASVTGPCDRARADRRNTMAIVALGSGFFTNLSGGPWRARGGEKVVCGTCFRSGE